MSEPAETAAPALGWLPTDPGWNAALGAIAPGPGAWEALVALAGARLDGLATIRLDRRLQKLFGEAPPPGLATRPVRLAVLASSTIDHLLPAIRVGGLRRGLWVKVFTGHYGQYAQELADPGSALHEFRPDTVLFAMDAMHLVGGIGDAAEGADDRLDAVADTLVRQWRQAREAFGARVIQQTVLPVFAPVFGNNEHRLPTSRARLAARLNERLRTLADAHGAELLAIDARVAQDGLRVWHDPVLWHRAKQEVHPAAAPLYGELVGRLLAAQQGRSFKCLVLDLDNTLWGGVIGDDGLEGIVLGQGSALGEAFVAFQHYARTLGRRGVILAVCSKNDEANALEPFDKHPEMVLRRGDIALFTANWTDKAANLREIARRLNIGLDSLVFADDNPFERNIVRRELPMVAVPELPADPALYAATIADAGYFEALHLTEEDIERTKQYQANLQRESLAASATDLAGYLRSLHMRMVWRRYDRVGLQRIVQLTNKTNQFNLTTRRTGDAEVLALLDDPAVLSLQIRLLDEFGDNGVIALIWGRLLPGTADLEIDTWLMSCRVLGRQVEEACVNLLARQARLLGAVRLLGTFVPSKKNAMVREHYAKLGFTRLSEAEDGASTWALPLESFTPFETHIEIVAGDAHADVDQERRVPA